MPHIHFLIPSSVATLIAFGLLNMVLRMDRGGRSGISDYMNCLVGHGKAIMESDNAWVGLESKEHIYRYLIRPYVITARS